MVIVFFARLAQFIIMAAGVKVMTTLLAPTELGKVAVIMATTGLLALMLVNPVGMYINRNLHLWVESGAFKITFIWMVKYLLFAAFVCLPLLLIIRIEVHALHMIPLFLTIILICGSILFNSIVQTLVPALNMLDERVAWALLTIGWITTGLLFSAGSVMLFGNVATIWLAGALGSHILFSMIAYRYFFHIFPGNPRYMVRPFGYRELSRFALPVAIGVVSNWVQFQGYRLYLADQIGLADLGFFFAGYSLAAWIMGAVEMTVSTVYQPNLYRDSHSKDVAYARLAWQRYSNRSIPYYLVSCIGIVVLTDELVTVLLAPEYKSVSSYVMVGAFAELGRIWLGQLSLLFQIEKNTTQMVYPFTVGSILAVVATLFLVPQFGIIAAPIVATASVIVTNLYVNSMVAFETQRSSFALPEVIGISALCAITGCAGIFIVNALGAGDGLFGSIVRLFAFAAPTGGVFVALTSRWRYRPL